MNSPLSPPKPVGTGASPGPGVLLRPVIWVALALPAVAWAFSPILDNGFLWDDRANILENPHFRGFSADNLAWMMSGTLMGHFHPLTWLSLALDFTVWGLSPGGFLLTNLTWHLLNTWLFGVLALQLWRTARHPDEVAQASSPGHPWLGPAALTAALLFGLHPLRVETVSWVTERRDVLSGAFWLLTFLAWLKARAFDTPASQRRAWYLLSLLAFLLSLMGKAWGITLPILLLLLDFYPLRRWTSDRPTLPRALRLIGEKAPFFLLAGVFAGIAIIAQKAVAMDMVPDHTLADRVAQSGFGLLFYPAKFLWPTDLSPLYLLRYDFVWWGWPQGPTAVAAIVWTAWTLGHARRRPALAVSWLAYLVIVSPVLGLAQSGPQLAADRYTYLALLPLLAWVTSPLSHRVPPAARGWALGAIGALALGLGSLTYRQATRWTDELTLWNHALRLDTSNYVAWNNRGLAFEERNQPLAARRDYEEAVRLYPDYDDALYNRGNMRIRAGDRTGGLADYNRCLQRNPRYTKALNNRGNLRRDLRDLAGSEQDLTRAIEVSPRYADAWYNRGLTRRELGDLTGALADYTRAVTLFPGFAAAYNNRAILRKRAGDLPGALSDYAAAVAANPVYFNAYFNRASLYRDEEHWLEALRDYDRAVRLDPRHVATRLHRGYCRWRQGLFEAALEDWEVALRLAPQDPSPRFYRAQLWWGQGQRQEAVVEMKTLLDQVPRNWPYRTEAERLLRDWRKAAKP